MSGATSSPAKAPKTMSSKLLTMKFMQRAAASSPISTPSTPDQPPSKRQRVGDSSPASLDIDSLADQRAVQVALAVEEAKRQIALERQAADAGDTRWVLTFKPDLKTPQIQGKPVVRVVETGFAAIDSAMPVQITPTEGEDVSSDRPLIVGRRSFGKFNRTIEKFQDPSNDDSSDSDSDSDSDNGKQSGDDSEDSEDDDTDGTGALIKAAQEANARKLKAERKEKRKAEKAELLRLAEKRKKKDIKLNQLTSISGSSKGQTCYRCGQTGHLQADCPKRGERGGLDKVGGTIRSKRSKKG